MEISDLNQIYLNDQLDVTELIKNQHGWIVGLLTVFFEGIKFCFKIQHKQKKKVACLEEIAYKNKWINKKNINDIIKSFHKLLWKLSKKGN